MQINAKSWLVIGICPFNHFGHCWPKVQCRPLLVGELSKFEGVSVSVSVGVGVGVVASHLCYFDWTRQICILADKDSVDLEIIELLGAWEPGYGGELNSRRKLSKICLARKIMATD